MTCPQRVHRQPSMSTRRSSRATKAVKYTSASEGSDFEDKKKRRTPKKSTKTSSTLKAESKKNKSKKRSAPDTDEEKNDGDGDGDGDDHDIDTPQAPISSSPPAKSKRQKRDPATLAAEARQKAETQEAKVAKQAAKKKWEAWLDEHNMRGQLLALEPDKDEAITQTDSLKRYGLKPAELVSLLHFEKKNPLYGGTMKLFVEQDVRALCFRKLAMLAGVEAEHNLILDKGEEMWKEEHKDDPVEEAQATKAEKPTKEKTQKQKWATYVTTHSIDDNDKLTKEPTQPINQSEIKIIYSLTPHDLTCLPYFPKKNAAYGNTAKVFEESEVKLLAYRKSAVLAGVDKKDSVALLERGKAIFEEQDNEEKKEEEEEEAGEE
ncbi:hypothetical protein GMOD_00007190 [Pyrenophora seminiperda CCB06]|uniref:XPA C-terminal domain-containing protein n=1 Tax=Pyrenophora seminiperda CCB06 TaxID=1302712 RepID=A0A3M7MCT4_9PLEO|nr:hypothetical protein GMOD_00007190 [Pyrenophora seminiperda CCB06]